MNLYLTIKLLHILSATVLFGTGLGIAFFMYKAFRSGSEEAIRVTTRHVVLADWIFTTPAVVIQWVTGLILAKWLGISHGTAWFVTITFIFVLVGACWVPVVRIQIRLRNMLDGGSDLAECYPLFKRWIALGIPAFLGVILLFAMMVYKPWMGWILIG